MTVPRVFVSYSHDSQVHKKWVMDLAVRLRNSGVDAALDQWDLQPGDDVPHFMERNLSEANRVLMVCTEKYVQKANNGTGGVGYEKMIVTANLMKTISSNKVVPIIRQTGTHNVPTFLTSKLYIDFSLDTDFEFSFDELLRALVGAPLFKKPPLGNNPFEPITNIPLERSADAVADLMRLVVSEFEKGHYSFILYADIVAKSHVSRVLLDLAIKQAIDSGLIILDSTGDVILTDAGKHYAVVNKMIRGI